MGIIVKAKLGGSQPYRQWKIIRHTTGGAELDQNFSVLLHVVIYSRDVGSSMETVVWESSYIINITK